MSRNEKENQETLQKAFDLRLGILVTKIQRRWKLYASKKTQKKQYDLSAQPTKPVSTKSKGLDSHKKSIESDKPIQEEIKPSNEPVISNPIPDEKLIAEQGEKPVEPKPDFSKPSFKPKSKKFNFSKQADLNASKQNANVSQVSNDADSNKLNPIAEPPIIKPTSDIPSQKPASPKQEIKANVIEPGIHPLNGEASDDISNNKYNSFSPKIEKVEKLKKEDADIIATNQYNIIEPNTKKADNPKIEAPITIPSANNQFSNFSPKIEKIEKPKKDLPDGNITQKQNIANDANPLNVAPSEGKTEEVKKPKKFNFAKKKKEEAKLQSELNNEPAIPSEPFNEMPPVVSKEPLGDVPLVSKEPAKIQIKEEPMISKADKFADLDNYDPLEKYNKKKNVGEVSKPVEPQVVKAYGEQPIYQPVVSNVVPTISKVLLLCSLQSHW